MATEPIAKPTNGRVISSVGSMNAYVKEIADIMRRSGRAGALQYVPEITWLLFLRILDEREQAQAREAAALGLPFRPTLEAPYRWFDWAAPYDPTIRDAQGRAQGWKRKELKDSAMGALMAFVNDDLIPTIRRMERSAQHGSAQHVLSQIFYNTPRTYIDTEYNLLEILDRVHKLSANAIDTTHIFPLSQVYEGLLLSMGQKNNDGGQFFTPREVIRVMVRVVDPQPGQTVYDPCCGTGGFLAEAFTYVLERYNEQLHAEQIEWLETQAFWGREKDALVYPIGLANLVLHGISVPHIWLGNTLTGDPTYTKLFEDAPSQYDIILTTHPSAARKARRRRKSSPNDHERTRPRSWTVDLEARRAAARVAAAPLQQRASEHLAEADALSKTIARLKARMTQIATVAERDALPEEIAQREEQQKQARKQVRTLQNEAQALLDAVYDLKAVNPHAVDAGDTRTPDELLTIIEETQQAISGGIATLRASRQTTLLHE